MFSRELCEISYNTSYFRRLRLRKHLFCLYYPTATFCFFHKRYNTYFPAEYFRGLF